MEARKKRPSLGKGLDLLERRMRGTSAAATPSGTSKRRRLAQGRDSLVLNRRQLAATTRRTSTNESSSQEEATEEETEGQTTDILNELLQGPCPEAIQKPSASATPQRRGRSSFSSSSVGDSPTPFPYTPTSKTSPRKIIRQVIQDLTPQPSPSPPSPSASPSFYGSPSPSSVAEREPLSGPASIQLPEEEFHPSPSSSPLYTSSLTPTQRYEPASSTLQQNNREQEEEVAEQEEDEYPEQNDATPGRNPERRRGDDGNYTPIRSLNNSRASYSNAPTTPISAFASLANTPIAYSASPFSSTSASPIGPPDKETLSANEPSTTIFGVSVTQELPLPFSSPSVVAEEAEEDDDDETTTRLEPIKGVDMKVPYLSLPGFDEVALPFDSDSDREDSHHNDDDGPPHVQRVQQPEEKIATNRTFRSRYGRLAAARRAVGPQSRKPTLSFSRKKSATTSAAKTTRNSKRNANQQEEQAASPQLLPLASTTQLLSRYVTDPKLKLSPEALQVIHNGTHEFMEQVSHDLAAFARHARRKTIERADVEMLMKRQRIVNEKKSITDVAHELLDGAAVRELVPIARAYNDVVPKRGFKRK